MTRIAILGATGEVGKAFLQVLEERNFPIEKIYLLNIDFKIDFYIVNF